MRIAVLNNLRAFRSGKLASETLSLLSRFPDVQHVETETIEVLPEALAELVRQEVDLLVVNGGDGTLQFALTELLGNCEHERVPLIAPLRGGRTNMTALDLGSQRDPVKALAGLIDSARDGTLAERFVPRPVLRVGSNRRREAHYGMFFGAGMIPRAIDLVHDLFPAGRSQGVFGAGVVTASLIVKGLLRSRHGVLAPDKAQILLDGEMVRDGEFYLLIASSLQRLFLRMNPFFGREPAGVRFTAIASNARHTKSAALGVLRGRPRPWVNPENGYWSRNADRAELRFDCGFTVDGEIFEPEPDEVVTLTADHRVTFVRT